MKVVGEPAEVLWASVWSAWFVAPLARRGDDDGGPVTILPSSRFGSDGAPATTSTLNAPGSRGKTVKNRTGVRQRFSDGCWEWQNREVPGGSSVFRFTYRPPTGADAMGVSGRMAVEVETKDCSALTDADVAELADMGAGTDIDFGVGHLSKAKEDWVLSTTARVDGRLHGFMFSTLERIGGTPCVLLGLVSVRKTTKRDAVMKGLMGEAFHRALMAFPDEDVVIGTRFVQADGFEAFKALTDIVPRPGHKAVGEERAWGRRLAKRFAVDATYDQETFVSKGQGSLVSHFDHQSLKPEKLDEAVVGLFNGLQPAKGDVLIACGWAMAENLLKLGAH
jgi:hypothetical protein